VGVATPHHDQSYGSLILIDPSKPDDGGMSQLTLLTPETKFPEWGRGKLDYGTPWPLSEELYLCNYRDTICLLYCSAGSEAKEGPGQSRKKKTVVRETLVTGERLRPIDPIPLKARAAPPAIPARVAAPRPGADADPDYDSDATGGPPSTIYVHNVYTTDEFGRLPPGVKIDAMRIVQVFPKTTPREDNPRISRFTESLVRASLGTVPVEADGSVYCEAPVGKAIYFQLLDADGMAVQSMRSVTYVHPGQMLACVGCHEGREQVSGNLAGPAAALRRAPSRLEPELQGVGGLEPGEPVNFYRLVKPVLDASCTGCHAQKGKGPDMSYKSLEPYLFGFEGRWNLHFKLPRFGGSRTVPGQFGARAAELYTGGYLTARSARCPGGVRLSGADLRRLTLWLDLNSNRLGAYDDEKAQQQGKLVRPVLD
jgi:hypothetical protein